MPDDGTEAADDSSAAATRSLIPPATPSASTVPRRSPASPRSARWAHFPLTVLTASEHPFPGLAPAEAARLNEVWDAGQEHWASLSTASELIRVDQTGHYIQLDQPAAVIEQIRRLLP